eukprot:COSAG02_NODE_49220_length_328_cov_0.742358_2_plen_49_part_01
MTEVAHDVDRGEAPQQSLQIGRSPQPTQPRRVQLHARRTDAFVQTSCPL